MLNCLLNSGSQRSYLSDEVVKGLGITTDSLPSLQFNMKTFLREDIQCLKEASINIAVGDNSLPIKVLFDHKTNLNLPISRLDDLTRNLKSAVFKLAADFDKTVNGEIKVEGLIGINAIQHMESFQKINCMWGCAWKLSSGIIPFGDVSHFLDFRPPEFAVVTLMLESSFSALASEPSLHTQVNSVLNPKPYYADSLEIVFENQPVERNLDCMFFLETVGTTENTLSSNDYQKIQELKNFISF